MAQKYEVQAGDCISSIAFERGFFPDTIWNHADNSELKKKRADPNILMPGDIVTVPDKRLKEISKPAKKLHRFKLKGVPAKLHLRLLHEGEPVKNKPYRLDVEGKISRGTTDGDGNIQAAIPPNADRAKLFVGEGAQEVEYSLDLGRLAPIGEVNGVKMRLRNLGYHSGECGPQETDDFRNALKAFEADHKLTVTGKMTEETLHRLKEIYGC
jgi:hypothetical protein